MTTNQQIGVLIHKFMTEEISVSEKAILDRWIAESEENRLFFEEASQSHRVLESLRERHQVVTDTDQQRAWQRMLDGGMVPGIAKVVKPRFARYVVAAAVFVGVALMAYLFFFKSTPVPAPAPVAIHPGKPGAVLTLSDGRQVVLDSAANAVLATQNGVAIKNQNGQLVYISSAAGSELVFNTLSTSRGQTYSTVLSDGSKIWLNAASSIRYPVAFTGRERSVEITGEAYFEVAHNKAMPFKVRVNGAQIEVTGTTFNVQAYADEPAIKTSLVTGSVTMAGAQLKPGQQAVLSPGAAVKVYDHVDLESITAWKNNLFIYNNTNITVLMRQLARWYNVQTSYQGNLKALTFSGQLSRYSDIGEALEILNLSGEAVFTLRGDTIVVSKH
jgi:transmembrane sensor